jgi:hypothetical protein
MKLGTHMPGGERRKPIDIEDRRTKVKVTIICFKCTILLSPSGMCVPSFI